MQGRQVKNSVSFPPLTSKARPPRPPTAEINQFLTHQQSSRTSNVFTRGRSVLMRPRLDSARTQSRDSFVLMAVPYFISTVIYLFYFLLVEI